MPPEVANQNIMDVATEFNDRLMADIEASFPDFVISPAIKLTPKERVEKFMLLIAIAYPSPEYMQMMANGLVPPLDKLKYEDIVKLAPLFNAEASRQELGWLLNPDYIDLIKAGVAPPPMSRPWSKLLLIPPAFKAIQKIFIRDYKSQMRRIGES